MLPDIAHPNLVRLHELFGVGEDWFSAWSSCVELTFEGM
jgi:hypothetical protein